MNDSDKERAVLGRLTNWVEKQPSVRAMLLTSTRANPAAAVDSLSDFDVILAVTDIQPFFDDRAWVGDFGKVLVAYWDPIYPAPEYGLEIFANVIQYDDGLRIDFTLWPLELLRSIVQAPVLPAVLDDGYIVLVDKDELTKGMKAPSYTAFLPARPSAQAFQLFVEEFFSDAPYVAKCLWRGDLMPAKWALDYDMKHVYFRQMLEWRVAAEQDWSVKSQPYGVRALGKGLKKHFQPEFWGQFENTYVGAGIEENWDALFKTIDLFRQVATEVADDLGYDYPDELDSRVTEYLKKFRRLGGYGAAVD